MKVEVRIYEKEENVICNIMCIRQWNNRFFANHLTEWYGCILFGIGVGLMVYSIANLNK